ncbi:LamG domain-containing protein [Streptomyces sp. NPDC093084]|uniref:LamG domain-containing protein n=1 Tax=Streptomyces sp. NPDC093084 TaxID=3155197 RepID=UPI00343771E3
MRRLAVPLAAWPLLFGSAAMANLTAAVPAQADGYAESAPSEQAKASGDPVEVVDQRTEYTQTFANPDGTYTLKQATTPQRAKDAAGTWHDIDTTLVRRGDGSVGPRYVAADESFSSGGTQAMVRLAKDQRALSVRWPGQLPAPSLDGATATYAEVLPGVDLQLTAVPDGYREILVVKSAEAAQQQALEQLRFAIEGDGVSVIPGAGGGLRAVDADDNAVFTGPSGQMWDSAGGSGEPRPQTLKTARTAGAAPTAAAADPDTPEPFEPGEGDTTAALPVQVDDGSITVTPDLNLLRGDRTVYPVRIDPAVGLSRAERTVLSSDGDKFYQFSGDYGVGRCSNADGYYCGDNYVNRMYYEFSPSALAGKHVLHATFRAHETWSFNCDAKAVDLERTGNISEGTRWPGPGNIGLIDTKTVSAGRGDNCSPAQPDAWVEFNGSLTKQVQDFADGKFGRLTLMLRAGDEGDPRAWKRFDDNAEISVDYTPNPGVPINVGVIPGVAGANAHGYCSPANSPLAVTVDQPTVRARVETQVQPGTNDSKGQLKANYRIARLLTDGTWEEIWAEDNDGGYFADGTLLDKQTTKRTDGTTYRYRARTQSHWSYNGDSGDLYSSFSPWCYFTIDSTAPKEPTIAPKDPVKGSPYVECVADPCTAKGGPGTAGSFVFRPNSVDPDISKYQWVLSGPSGQEGKAHTVGAKSDHTAGADDVTPSMGGSYHLTVWAIDVRNRTGSPQEFDFQVSLPPGPVGRWHFNDGAPGSGVTTAKDSSADDPTHDPTAPTHDLTMHDGAGFSTMARRGEEDTSLWLDSSDPSLQQSYAASTEPVVNTAHSFTVSAWVYLTDASTSRMILAEPGAQAQAFALYYSSSTNSYVFHYTATDSATPVFVKSVATATAPPLKVWTHLAGVYTTGADASGDTIQLFVNGRPQGDPVNLSKAAPTYKRWEASQGLQVGRSIVRGAAGQYFRGRIDEPAMWQQALSTEEIAKEAQATEQELPATELVADWDAETSSGTTVSESSPYPIGAMTLSGGATIDNESSTLVLNGSDAYASVVGPAIDETGSFTVSAQAQFDLDALNKKPDGYEAQLAAQAGSGGVSWALAVQKIDQDVYVWKFLRTTPSGTTVTTADVTDVNELADPNSSVILTGVYDAQDQGGRMHLYVGATPVDDGAENAVTSPQQGTGSLSLGGTTSANYFAGQLSRLRIWVGAMTADEVRDRVISNV